MLSVGKIKHPVFEMKLVNEQFTPFGKVMSFSYYRNGTTGYGHNLKLLQVCWTSFIKVNHCYYDKRTTIPPVTVDKHVYVDKKVYPQ